MSVFGFSHIITWCNKLIEHILLKPTEISPKRRCFFSLFFKRWILYFRSLSIAVPGFGQTKQKFVLKNKRAAAVIRIDFVIFFTVMTFDDERNQNVWMFESLAIVMINSNRTHEPESWEWNKWNEMNVVILYSIQLRSANAKKAKVKSIDAQNARKDLHDGAIGYDFINSREKSVENRKSGIEKLSKICISIQFNSIQKIIYFMGQKQV